MFNTPILFLIFNRPVETQIVFNRIREIKPKYLYVASDGPRTNNFDDIINCKITKNIINQVDWDCEVKTLYRETNLGCGTAVSQGITWFFNQVEQGIILEDDCLPDTSFFRYCEELLNQYKTDERVYNIGGVNFQNNISRGTESYYFSAISHIWGWATWRRAWQKYNLEINDLDTFITENKIKNYYSDSKLVHHWLNKFKLIADKKIDTWDYQWTYTIMQNNGISIVPNKNLVSNIGFGENATHTTEVGKYSCLPTSPIELPLLHNNKLVINTDADTYYFFEFDKFFKTDKSLTFNVDPIKLFISTVIENTLTKTYFDVRNKNSNSVLIKISDSENEYIITRNIIEYFIKHSSNSPKNFFLLANSSLKSLIENGDEKLYKGIIYYDLQLFKKFKLILDFQFKLKKYKFNQVINISNESHLEIDKLLTHIGANETISNNNDFLKFENEEKLKVKYSKIINENKLDERIEHLFITSKHFFERLINDKITIAKPSYSVKAVTSERNTLIIFPDHQTVYQKWSKENFISLIKKVTQKVSDIDICIISLNVTNQILCEAIKTESSVTLNHIHNPAFDDLINLMCSANVLLGNDSVFAHIAAAINKNYICLSNGQFLNKSMPYPVEMNVPQVMVYPAELEMELLQNEKAKYYFYKQSKIDINFISVDSVMNVILKQINH